MLTKTEMKQLEKMLEKEGITGKKFLRAFIWGNNTKSKFKVGDNVSVSDRAVSICGERLIDWNGTVKKVMHNCFYKYITYEVEISYAVNGNKKTSSYWFNEENVKKSKSKKIKRFKFDKEPKYYESISL